MCAPRIRRDPLRVANEWNRECRMGLPQLQPVVGLAGEARDRRAFWAGRVIDGWDAPPQRTASWPRSAGVGRPRPTRPRHDAIHIGGRRLVRGATSEYFVYTLLGEPRARGTAQVERVETCMINNVVLRCVEC